MFISALGNPTKKLHTNFHSSLKNLKTSCKLQVTNLAYILNGLVSRRFVRMDVLSGRRFVRTALDVLWGPTCLRRYVRKTFCQDRPRGFVRETFCQDWAILGHYFGNTWALLRQYKGNTRAILEHYLGNTLTLLGQYLNTTWALFECYFVTT